MAPPSHIFRLVRPAFRQQFQRTANTGFQGFTLRSAAGRRFASGVAGEAEPVVKIQQNWLKRMWDSPIGFKTVHFWAPVMKWCIVIAGISDLSRPAEKLSLTQNGALTATATVNFFLAIVGVVQVGRILNYNYTQKGELPQEQVTEAKESVIETGKKIEKKIEGAIKS